MHPRRRERSVNWFSLQSRLQTVLSTARFVVSLIKGFLETDPPARYSQAQIRWSAGVKEEQFKETGPA